VRFCTYNFAIPAGHIVTRNILKSRAEKFKGFALAQHEALCMHQYGALGNPNMVHAPFWHKKAHHPGH
jgi:hypothetical protein